MGEAEGRGEETLGRHHEAAITRRLLRYLVPYRVRVAGAIVLLVLGSALEMVGPWITMLVLDRAIPERDFDLLWMLAGAYAAALLLSFMLEYSQTLLTTWIGQRVMYDLRVELFGHIQRLSLRFFDRNPVGRLMTRITNDVEVLNELFSSGVVSVFGDVFTLFFIFAAMLLMSPRLALVTFAVLPFVFLAAFVFRGLIREANREIRVKLARINAFLQERITGIRVVQLFGRERDTFRRFDEINHDHLRVHLRSITYYAAFFPIIEILTAVAFALILWYGGVRILEGTLTVGIVAAFLQYARRFFRPIQDLSEKYNMLQGAIASSERIFALLDTGPDIADPGRPDLLPAGGRGAIEFRDVWFRYDAPAGEQGLAEADDAGWVLRGISFRIEAGQRVAVVGATGAGKTTLINLLMRFSEPQRGEILFDGVPIQRVALDELRSRIGLVLQDVFLFSQDARFNIRLDELSISEERLRLASDRVGAGAVIERLPLGYDQPLGERGASLSVGERQLISFARALAFDPLVLILDEATSSVDAALEAQIDRALDELMRGRTSLVIAHRLSTIRNADRILVLHRGEIRESGTHAALLRAGGLYSRLYELQFVPAGDGARSGTPAER